MTIIRALWRFLVGVKDALVLTLLLLFFFGLWALVSGRAALSVPGGAALVLNLNGSLVDQARERSPLASFGGGTAAREYQTRDVVRAVANARTDARIKAVVLQMDTFLGGGQANLQAVGAELDKVRAAGKPVYAYATAYTDDSYQLASHASEIWANPLGGVFLTGPAGTICISPMRSNAWASPSTSSAWGPTRRRSSRSPARKALPRRSWPKRR